MSEPLDYFNPQGKDAPRARRGPAPAVPAEFDVVLTRTADHGGARAVENELACQKVPYFRTEGGDPVERVVQLHVRSADHAYAAQLAAMVFARRKRLNEIDPRRPAPRTPDWSDGSGLIG
jgi:hypothetical protein